MKGYIPFCRQGCQIEFCQNGHKNGKKNGHLLLSIRFKKGIFSGAQIKYFDFLKSYFQKIFCLGNFF